MNIETVHTPLKKTLVGRELRKRIDSGELASGVRLRRGTELAAEFGVSHVTIRAVLKELAEEGYIEVIHGRGSFVLGPPGLRRAGKILVVYDLMSPAERPYNYIMPDFYRRCQERGVACVTESPDFLRAAPPEPLAERLCRDKFSGVLLAAAHYRGNEQEVAILRRLKVPVLIAHGAVEDIAATGFGVIHYDVEGGWATGLRYLSAMGHRRVAVLGYAPYGLRVPESRHRELCASCGLDTAPELIRVVPLKAAAVEKALAGQLALRPAPTAVFCHSDFFAIFVYQALRQMRVRVPEDVSVLGFCGYPGAEYLSPPLSTIDLSYAATGRRAADVLIEHRRYFKPEGVFSELSPLQLIERRSVKNITCNSKEILA